MGARAGGSGTGWGAGSRGASFDNATFTLYGAISGGNKSSIVKATNVLKQVASKMPTSDVKQIAASANEAAWLTKKGNGPKSEYNAATYKYNSTLSKVFNAEANKRK